jgi:hypothetical protein
MNLAQFKSSLSDPEPPAGLSKAVEALWWDGKGAWEKAHNCAQEDGGKAGAWVHAYLHRKEGDPANAAYWYRRADRAPSAAALAAEWDEIARALLAGG